MHEVTAIGLVAGTLTVLWLHTRAVRAHGQEVKKLRESVGLLTEEADGVVQEAGARRLSAARWAFILEWMTVAERAIDELRERAGLEPVSYPDPEEAVERGLANLSQQGPQ